MKIENVKPADIEKRSFEIITEILEETDVDVDPRYAHIIKRCIHTSADFDYARTMFFSEGVEEKIASVIKSGGYIVTDTKMALSGINKKRIEAYGGKVLCFIGDGDVAAAAKDRGLTRSYVSMEKAADLDKPAVFAIGNAPTALIAICELSEAGRLKPEAVVGAPVGFVNVVAAKKLLIDSGIPSIVPRGRKGGSNIAAAIINAVQYNM